jgi:hypothetical protein
MPSNEALNHRVQVVRDQNRAAAPYGRVLMYDACQSFRQEGYSFSGQQATTADGNSKLFFIPDDKGGLMLGAQIIVPLPPYSPEYKTAETLFINRLVSFMKIVNPEDTESEQWVRRGVERMNLGEYVSYRDISGKHSALIFNDANKTILINTAIQ